MRSIGGIRMPGRQCRGRRAVIRATRDRSGHTGRPIEIPESRRLHAQIARVQMLDCGVMTRPDFRIEQSFWTATGEWKCTDIGTRVVVAVKVDEPDTEVVFDEDDFEGCAPTEAEWRAEFGS